MKKQFALYTIIGGVQYLFDALVFAIAILLIPAEFANLLSRGAGALVGYRLNSKITFFNRQTVEGDGFRFARYFSVWAAMTVVSTLAIRGLLMATESDDWTIVVLTKLGVEATLVAINFFLLRSLVFR